MSDKACPSCSRPVSEALDYCPVCLHQLGVKVKPVSADLFPPDEPVPDRIAIRAWSAPSNPSAWAILASAVFVALAVFAFAVWAFSSGAYESWRG